MDNILKILSDAIEIIADYTQLEKDVPYELAEWVEVQINTAYSRLLRRTYSQSTENKETSKMRYIIDVDSLKKCLEFIDSIKVNGQVYVALENVTQFIDCFPKESFDIPDLMVSEVVTNPDAGHE